MRTDTEPVPGAAKARNHVLAVSGALLLLAGVACGGAEEEGEPAAERGDTGTPVALGDLEAVERDDLSSIFTDAGVDGTFVLYDVHAGSAVLVGAEQARERAVPASTFKLPNTLIALETRVVSDIDEVVFAEGEGDSSLREALPTTDVTVHHEIAHRIGYDRMSTWVDRFDYGNRQVGEDGEPGRFWVEGPLEISAVEQATFLAALARSELPVDVEHQEALQESVALEEGDGYRLFGRTGLGAEADPSPGWWVGWVEVEDGLYTFALRLDVEQEGDADLRESLGRDFLVELDALPAAAAGN